MRPDAAEPVEGEVLVTGPHADPDRLGEPRATGFADQGVATRSLPDLGGHGEGWFVIR